MKYDIQEKWEKRSAVRSKPRILFDPALSGYFYPIAEQPLATHPLVLKKGDEAIRYLLIQSLYKYSNDIATIETRVVSNVILNAIMNTLPISLSKEQKLSLYTILVDEAYHAYVAYDAMMQIEDITQVIPLPLPRTIEIEKAIIDVKSILPQKYHEMFDLIAVCLAENTLTKDIIAMLDKSETHPFFQKIIKDHLIDESRHSGIFFHLLKYIWKHMSDEYKQHIGFILPLFLEKYLGIQVQVGFDKQVLLHLGFSESEATSILNDIYQGFKLTQESPKLKNIIIQLQKAGVIDQFTKSKLNEKNWLNE